MTEHRAHPIRWRNYVSFSQKLVSVARDTMSSAVPTEHGFQRLVDAFQLGWNDRVTLIPRETRPLLSGFWEQLSIAVDAATFWSRYRNIYSLTPELFLLLSKTKVSDVPLAALNWPHQFFYVAFPSPNGFSWTGSRGFEFEGAYVKAPFGEKGHLEIRLIARGTERPVTKANWPGVRDIALYLGNEVKAGDTVSSFFERAFEQKISDWSDPFIHAIRKEALDIGGKIGVKVVVPSESDDQKEVETLYKARLAAADALGVVVNAICYLSTAPRIDDEWPQDTPKRLLSALSDTPRKRQRAQSELISLSIIPVHVLGRNIDSPASTAAPAEAVRTVATHWRRGHFRSVGTGPNRAITRIKWIRPVLVNEHSGEATPGRVQVHKLTVQPAVNNERDR